MVCAEVVEVADWPPLDPLEEEAEEDKNVEDDPEGLEVEEDVWAVVVELELAAEVELGVDVELELIPGGY